MAAILTIDQGNTLAKVAIFRDDQLVEIRRYDSLCIETLALLLEQYDVESAIYSSVASIDVRLVESLRVLLDYRVLTLTSSTPLPITIDYDTRATLGADRVAAAVGAHQRHPRRTLLVVDAGSAITLDMVDSNGHFRGGNIAPGIDMRLQAMHQLTHRLPLVDCAGPTPLLGHDTPTALRSGAVLGAAFEVIALMQQLSTKYDCSQIIITGGNAMLLADKIKEFTQFEITVADALVAEGLYHIYLHNEDI